MQLATTCEICGNLIYDMHGLCLTCHRMPTPPPFDTPDRKESPPPKPRNWNLDSGGKEIIRREQFVKASVLVQIVHRRDGTFDVLCDDDAVRRDVRKEREQIAWNAKQNRRAGML